MKRVIAGVLLAAALAWGLMAIIPSECSWLTPDNTFLWWLYGCSKESGGGGESGAS